MTEPQTSSLKEKFLPLSPAAGLRCFYAPPTGNKPCFVFINAITGNAASWHDEIAPPLLAQGYGVLTYNMRGQEGSPFDAEDILDEALIISDLQHLLSEIKPPQPVLVGLSIGGLFAMKTFLKENKAHSIAGLVLINTLRKAGTGLSWINEAIYRAAKMGGQQLVMDLFLPYLVGPAKLEELRANCLSDAAYTPFPETSGLLKLLENSRNADWDVVYEKLDLPALSITGLRDRAFLNLTDVDNLLARMPNVKNVMLQDAGHLLPLEAGPELAALLLDFAGQLNNA